MDTVAHATEPALAPAGLSARIALAARELGFTRVGFTRVKPLESGRLRLEQFLAKGYAGGMSYLSEEPRHDPTTLLPGAKSVIVVALAYGDRAPDNQQPGALSGRVARYAQGTDYHIVLKQKLSALADRLPELAGRPVQSRACVDTAPLLERELAESAGIGFHGKSTLVIAPGAGSYVLLGELVVDLELESNDVSAASIGCGSCRACLDACPSSAFVGPHELDARRCISYLTIEHTGVIPEELRSKLGDRVFGCDACQEVCPYNHGASARQVPDALEARPELAALDLIRLLELGSADYRKLVRRSALRRTNRATLQRNAAVALGNSKDPRAVAPLARALESNPSPVVRLHVAWALGALERHLDATARQSLRRAADFDEDPEVRREARRVLDSETARQGAG